MLIKACIVLMFLIIIYIIYSIYKGYKLVFEGCHPNKNKSLDLDTLPYKTRRFSFISKDYYIISAIEFKPNITSKGTIMACHYLGGSKTSIYTYIEPLLLNGFTVVAFDYINHGDSMTRISNKYTLEDEMERFINKIKELGINGPYGTIGFSMGATIALSAVDCMPEIKAVVVDSGPLLFVKDYFKYVLKNKMVKNKLIKAMFLFLYLYIIGFYKMSKRMIKRLKIIGDLPVMFIHSRNDNIISYKNAEYAYKLLNSKNAELITVEKAHHLTNKIILGSKYDDKIVDFFNKWLI